MLAANDFAKQALRVDGADLEIRAHLAHQAVTIDIMKSGACVHRVTIPDAVGRLENGWIAELFAQEHRVDLATLAREVDDYIVGLDVNQG